MKGVPLRLEMGPRDIENNQCVAVRRDTGEKIILSLEDLTAQVQILLDSIHETLYQRALNSLEQRIYTAADKPAFLDLITNKPGFVRAMWCGDEACELQIKEETGGNFPLFTNGTGTSVRNLHLLRQTRETSGDLGESLLS